MLRGIEVLLMGDDGDDSTTADLRYVFKMSGAAMQQIPTRNITLLILGACFLILVVLSMNILTYLPPIFLLMLGSLGWL